MDFDDIKLQERLTEKQLTIFHAEMARQHRSLTVGYLLLVFLGTLGLHKFYIGRIWVGIVYALLFVFGLGLLSSGGLISVFGTGEDIAAGAGMGSFGLFLLICLGFCLLWDIITLPRQVNAREKRIRQALLQKFDVKPEDQ